MKKWLSRLVLLVSGVLLAAVLGLYALVKFGQPDTQGISTRDYIDSAEQQAAGDGHWLKRLSREGRPPNIVVILADDLGYGDLSSNGSTVIKTPEIDRLAAEGMRFTDFYSAMPVCTPSRAGMLTGRYPPRTGLVTAGQAKGDSFMRKAIYKAATIFAQLGVVDMRGGANMVEGLPQSEITIAEVLKAAGYKTAAFGKWHLGDFTELPEYHPHEHGFDRFAGFNVSNDDWPVAYWDDQTELVEDIGVVQEDYTREFTEAAVSFIEQNQQQPFFVYLAQKDPHQPFHPSHHFKGSTDAGPYGDAVAEFDWSAGHIARTLERLGLDKNTLLIVTSDNGPWFEGSSGGLRGRKGQTYEGGFRVPMVAWWPGTIEAGSVGSTPGMNIDFLPTAAELAGVALPDDRIIDGQSLVPILLDKPEPPELANRAIIYFDDWDAEGLRQGDWKVLASHNTYTWPLPLDAPDSFAGKVVGGRDYIPADGSEPVPTLGYWPALYNVRRDLHEAYNLKEREPEKVDALMTRLLEWRSGFYANPRGWN